jgi:FSR family fosmidomycin resistance protein-like MFS transporter
MAGLGLLAFAPGYGTLLLGACLIGLGSAVFHPEASRVARLAAGGRFGMAQSVFQVGGNTGQAIGPLLAAFIVVPFGRGSIAWFAAAALGGIVILARVGAWYAATAAAAARRAVPARELPLPRRRVVAAIGILVALVLAKTIYTSGVTSFYTFFLIERFGLGTQEAQVMLFLFLGAIAVGTVVGGPVADRIGAAPVIWSSAIGAIPLALALPYLGLAGTALVSVALGVVMAIAFPVIVVFAQQLLPGRVGLVSGIFFGLAFGMGGLAAAALGLLADRYGIVWIFEVTAFAPVVGLIALFLPRKRSFFPG